MTTTAQTHREFIPAKAPFDFRASLRFCCSFAPGQGDQKVIYGALHKAFRIDGRDVALAVREAASGTGVDVDMAADNIDTDLAASVVGRVRFWLSLDDDLTALYGRAEDDPGFASVLQRLHGYHQVKFATPWENVAWAIMSARSPQPVARSAKNRLVEALSVPTDSGVRPFPDAEQVERVGEAALAALLRNRRKATYLWGSARRWSTLSERELRNADIAEALTTLTSLPGIGPWSAAFVLVRGLGRMEILPEDKTLCSAAARAYGRPIGVEDLRTLAAPYGAQRGYWAHYLRAAG